MNLRRTRAIARKETLHILRDPRSLLMALAIPFLLLILFSYALTLDVDRIPTMIYDADQTPASRELIRRLQGSRYFQVLAFTDRYATIERAIDQNTVLIGIVIPRGFARDLFSGQQATVQLLLDGSDSNTASIALGYVNTLLQLYALEWRTQMLNRRQGGEPVPPVEGRIRVWYNSELRSRNYIVPGLIAIIMMIIASLLTSLTIAREWEMGTMEQLLSTPLRPAELILGKMVPYFGIGLIDMLIALSVGTLVFRVPLRGSLLFLGSVACLFLFGALCWGLLLSALTRSQLLAYQMSILTSFLPSFLLSGFIYAIENMPRVIQLITYLIPARYFITILQGIFLKGIGLSYLVFETGMLLLFAGVVFWGAMRALPRKLV
ncbi:MAG: ABC transporter permease [Nitrospinota bacterium]|nr:MAG: ABC transporter permease [Nitrospinota bacterium]